MGTPIKKKKMLARYARGGGVSPSKTQMAWDSVTDSIKNLPTTLAGVPRKAATYVKEALTIEPTKKAIEDHEAANRKALEAPDEYDTVQTKRKGGMVKAKPRGVGKALRGQGRGKFL